MQIRRNRSCQKRRSGRWVIAALLILPWNPSRLSAQERMVVHPAGVATWQDLVDLQATKGTQRGVESSPVPFMPGPPPRPVGFNRSGAPTREASSNQSPAIDRTMDGPRIEEATRAGADLDLDFPALLDNNTRIPPDTMGAVGPAHVMTMLNSQVLIQDKSGNVVQPPVSLQTFWAPAGVPNVFDPRIVYDQGAGRWLATADAESRSPDSAVLFAISTTSDPTGEWTFFSFDADPTNTSWADFPDLGFNGTWIAITNNMFPIPSGPFVGAAMWVIDKSTALAGGPLTLTVFPAGFDSEANFATFGASLRVCTTFDDPGILYMVDDSGFFDEADGRQLVRVSQITGTGASPIWSVVSGSIFPNTGLFRVANNFDFRQVDAPQLGTTDRVETNDPRMLDADFRNGSIWCTHTGGLPVGSVDRTAVFWYQIDPQAMIATGEPIVQSGVFDGGPDVHHFFPSIAANINNDVCIGFSRSDSTKFIEAVFSGRRGIDLPGLVDPISVLKLGEDSYFKTFGGTRNRWGDYSATVVDPADDKTFWTLQEYAALSLGAGSTDDRWGTWWGRKIPKETIPNFSQRPADGERNVPSNLEDPGGAPNVVMADDFLSDGRPIACVRWWGNTLGTAPPPPCDFPNGGFEKGSFDEWTAATGPGFELWPWRVTSGGGPDQLAAGFPAEGRFFAQNGFDGDAGLIYDLYREIEIPPDAASAVLEWTERIQWAIEPPASQARQYRVTIQPAGGGAAIATLFSMALEPRTSGDTGYVLHSVDLLALAPEIVGTTVRLNWHENIPETFTGPAQFDLDAVRLLCDTPSSQPQVSTFFLAEPSPLLNESARARRLSEGGESFARLRAGYAQLRARALAARSGAADDSAKTSDDIGAGPDDVHFGGALSDDLLQAIALEPSSPDVGGTIRGLLGAAFGWEAQNDLMSTFDLGSPESLTLQGVPLGGQFWGAMEFGNDGDFSFMYALNFTTNQFATIDTATGVVTDLGFAFPFGDEKWTGLAMDPTDGTMYASSSAFNGFSSLYTVALGSNFGRGLQRVTRIGDITNAPGIVGIAIDKCGIMFGYDSGNDMLLQISKINGNSIVIGPLGFDAEFGQGMEFDEQSGILYLSAFNVTELQSELRIADTSLGRTALVGTLGSAVPGGVIQIPGLGIAANANCTTPDPDGWLIGFHEPLSPGQAPGPALGVYFCDFDDVRSLPAAEVASCDGEPVFEYFVELSDCCLLHADPDGRTGGPAPAQPDAFNGAQCLEYDISIQAIVGRKYVRESPDATLCIEFETGKISNVDYWGWHSTNVEGQSRAALTATVTMDANGEWQYGPWSPAGPSCGSPNMAFELMTPDLTQPPGCCDCPGDLNGDGSRDGRDIEGFLECLLGGAGQNAPCECADLNGADGPDVNDIPAFVRFLLQRPLCPL